MSLRTPLAKVRGLGSAKEGVEHWWWQRVTGVALVPLLLWFVFIFISKLDAPYEEVVQWLGSPWVATLMILLLVAMFYHAALGLQVVVEDYVHKEAVKLVSMLVIKFILALLAVASVVSVLKIAL